MTTCVESESEFPVWATVGATSKPQNTNGRVNWAMRVTDLLMCSLYSRSLIDLWQALLCGIHTRQLLYHAANNVLWHHLVTLSFACGHTAVLNSRHRMPAALLDDVRGHLRTSRLGCPLRGAAEVDSTNRELRAWARNGAPEGSTFFTEYQAAGRGRLGRTWSAAPGRNLMFSVLLCPSAQSPRSLLPLMAALGVSDALRQVAGPEVGGLKWPNDVRCGDRKVGGILLEAVTSPDTVAGIVVGIGLNVNQQAFPPALQDTATSLLLHTGRTIDRAALFATLLHALEKRYEAWEAGHVQGLLRAFEARMAYLGTTVTLHPTDTAPAVTGEVLGLSRDGGLRLMTPDGERVVLAGDVTSQPTPHRS